MMNTPLGGAPAGRGSSRFGTFGRCYTEDTCVLDPACEFYGEHRQLEHVHDDTLNCLACYYGEPDQFSPPSGALTGDYATT